MTDSDWKSWVAHHTRLFRWTAAEDLAMLNLWRQGFEGRGFTADEMIQASSALAEDNPKNSRGDAIWRAEHFSFILNFISSARLMKQRAAILAEEVRHRTYCTQCLGCGFLFVPNLCSVVSGDWVHPFSSGVIACDCKKGEMRLRNHAAILEHVAAAKNKKKYVDVPRLMCRAEYEEKNPFWKSQIETREMKRRTEQEIRDETHYADTSRGPLDNVVLKVIGRARRAPEKPKPISRPIPVPKDVAATVPNTCPF